MHIPLRRWHGAPAEVLLFSSVLFFVALVYFITIDQQQLATLMVYIPGLRENMMWERVLTEKTYLGVAQDDPALWSYIRHNLLQPPSHQPYNLTNPANQHFSQFGQSSYADGEVLHGMTGGFFVEVGAVDGEFLSNTLFFERNRNWTGLLIEAFPQTYQQLQRKHRKAHSINAALAIGNVSSEVHFASYGEKGVLGLISKNSSSTYISKALPFYSILMALNVTQIDFFSLDIEGVEMKVLRTIPWDKIKIRLMCVEINHIPEGSQTLIEFMIKQGYKFLGIRTIDAWFGWPALLNQTMNIG